MSRISPSRPALLQASFTASSCERVEASEGVHLIRLEGSWRGPRGAAFSQATLLVGNGGGSQRLQPLPARDERLQRFRRGPWRASYAVPVELLRDSTSFKLELAGREVAVLPLPVERGLHEPAPPRPAAPDSLWRPLALLTALIGLACLLQAPGNLIADTKLDLVVDPAGFLDRALHLWDARGGFGQLQNQAVGYLFPTGPFFALGHALGIPMWIVQRAWLTLVLGAALWGAALLARALGVRSQPAAVLAGAAYALSPLFLTRIGVTSAGLLPAALLPWVMLPLVHGSRRGSPARAAALSGLAVLAMGGVNAVSTLAVLPLPALWLLTRAPSPRRRSLTRWWVACVGLACAWWVLPLLFQARYGFNFIRYTESVDVTTAATSAVELLRGTGDWLGYLHLGAPWLPAGWALASEPVAILGSVALAAAGLFGLARRGLPERGFLVAALALGAVLVGSGYWGPLGGGLSDLVRDGIDSHFSALRNVYKFEPVLRLALAIGLAGALAALASPRLRRLGLAALAAAVLAGALPLLSGEVAPRGSFERIPDQWRATAHFLERNAPDSRSLLLPAAAFGEYSWGRPLDEPLQPLARSPWAARSLIPLGGVGSTRLLDAVEARLVADRPSRGLKQYLRRAGVRYVVVRNELDWRRAGAPRPLQVRRVLLASGLRRVARFGPPLGAPPATPGFLPDRGLPVEESGLRAIEVYDAGRVDRVTVQPAARVLAVSGGPGALLQLADRGLLGDRPAVLAGDPLGRRARDVRDWAVSDDLRRRDVDYGLVHESSSYALAPGERVAGSNAAPRSLLPFPGAGHEATVAYQGAAAMSASSYGSWLFQLPELGPPSAFDGDPATSWVAARGRAAGQDWVELRLRRPAHLSSVVVRALYDGPWRPRVRAIEVTTDAGSRTSSLAPSEGPQRVPVARGPTRRLRVTLARVEGASAGGPGAGLREVDLPGVAVSRPLALPAEPELLRAHARPGSPPPLYTLERSTADPRDPLRRDEERALERELTLPRAAALTVSGEALPRKGRALDRLLTNRAPLRISASSSWSSLPEYRAANLIDGRRDTRWIAESAAPPRTGARAWPGARALAAASRGDDVSPVPSAVDPHPVISLRWPGARTLRTLRLAPAGGFAVAPRRIRLSSPAGGRELTVGGRRTLRFAPLRTDRVKVSFPRIDRRLTNTGGLGAAKVPLPVGLAELSFPALGGLAAPGVLPTAPLRVPCGEGPSLAIDNRSYLTTVTGKLGDLAALSPLRLRICSSSGRASLDAGRHLVGSQPSAAFALGSLTLAGKRQPAAGRGPRSVRVRRWDAERRSLQVGRGREAYLAVHENFNKGWQAKLDGKRLESLRLDGWQQGFVLPTGAGGRVELAFAPAGRYRAALIAGALAALALLAIVLLARSDSAPSAGARRPPGVLALAGLATLALFLVAGPLALLVPGLILVGLRRPWTLPVVAGLALLAAGALVALDPSQFPGSDAGAFGAPAQLLAALALGAVLAAFAARRRAQG